MADNVFDDMRRAVVNARETLQAADNVSNDMAWLLKGRLKNVSNAYTLAALKRELRDFDITRHSWKD